MALEDRGSVVCPFSGSVAAVRRNAKGRLYFNCPSCGVVQPHGAGFQSWMMDNAELYGPGGKPEVEPPQPVPTIIGTTAGPVSPVVEAKKETPPPVVEKKTEAMPAAPVKKSALEGWTL